MALKYLPINYLRIAAINPGEDKKLTRKLNLLSVGVGVLMVCAGRLFVPFSAFLYTYAVTKSDIMRTAALIPALLIYAVLYTAMRGLILRKIGKIRPGFGINGISPYASSGAYLSRREFTVSAFLPPVFFAVLYFILNLTLPIRWFWFVYFLQIINLTGAVWEIYAVWFAYGMAEDVLILDGGVYTEFYAKAELAER